MRKWDSALWDTSNELVSPAGDHGAPPSLGQYTNRAAGTADSSQDSKHYSSILRKLIPTISKYSKIQVQKLAVEVVL